MLRVHTARACAHARVVSFLQHCYRGCGGMWYDAASMICWACAPISPADKFTAGVLLLLGLGQCLIAALRSYLHPRQPPAAF